MRDNNFEWVTEQYLFYIQSEKLFQIMPVVAFDDVGAHDRIFIVGVQGCLQWKNWKSFVIVGSTRG